ncbi:hypothetical protein [Phenylobacterium sp.]|uniref:hypothetical protein n=1 Tax=Phenylobacterium sp. TaxID=1871053 RepID=UPI0025DE9569|nr:hypothetical protein [Phenylobacterium sp.]MBX3482226.1 hypothetical protein [Phenylobacterium sp.]
MTIDIEAIQRRRKVMMIANVVAALVAVIGIMLYAQGRTWAIALVIVAVAGGFAVQMWFMAAVRGRKGDS